MVIGFDEVWYPAVLVVWFVVTVWFLKMLRMRGCVYWLVWMFVGVLTAFMGGVVLTQIWHVLG